MNRQPEGEPERQLGGDPPPLPGSVSTFVDILRWRAEMQPTRAVYTFLADGESDERTLTFGALDRRARAIAALVRSHAAPGDRALVLYPPGLDYVASLFGCLYAGVIAVPVYPPRPNRSLERLEVIAQDSGAVVALADAAVAHGTHRIAPLPSVLATLSWLSTDGLSEDLADRWVEPRLRPDGIALLQYTSGSTGAPRGVMLSHDNLMQSQAVIGEFFEAAPEKRSVFWLPPYHDMGLIGGILPPCYFGAHTTLMAPFSFLQRPVRWLQAISNTRASISGGPTFAYDLCARAVTEEQVAALDLSSWDFALVGAEPVRAEVVARFADVFAPCGFRHTALHPCYGLAEATLTVTGGYRDQEPIVGHFDAEALKDGLVVDASGSDEARCLVGCGHPPAAHKVRIVDPDMRVPSASDRVGEVWVRGPSLARGYWNRPAETEATFEGRLADTGDGPYLRSGDLGFIRGSELFVTGRLKDLIILRGRNFYPQDIERTAERSHPALRPYSGAAFSVEQRGDEVLVVVQEVERTQRKTVLGRVCDAIRQAVTEEHEVAVHAVVLVKPGSIPKTSSGKIQRRQCRNEFLNRSLQVLEQSVLGPDSRHRSLRRYVPPRSPLEQALTAIWEEVLGVAPIGITERFFELGGDSLLLMQTLGRAREAGIHLSVSDVLQHATIAELVKHTQAPSHISAEQGLITGPVPLTPRQHLFFERGTRHERAERTILEVRRRLDPEVLRMAVRYLFAHHDALRMRFLNSGDGWRAHIEESNDHEIVSQVDISGLADEEARLAIEYSMKVARKGINPRTGPLLRIVLFERGDSKPQLLLFAIHHLVADSLSVAVLGEDLQSAYEQLYDGRPVRLPPKTTSVKSWGERLSCYANSPDARRELRYWLSAVPAALPSLPVDYPDGSQREGRMRRVLVVLEPSETGAILDLATIMYQVQIDRVVLGALGLVFSRWTGQPFFHFEYSGHGRDPIVPDVDLSRTAGWFAARFPVFISLDQSAGVADWVAATARILGGVPHGGLGYGILRYLTNDRTAAEALRQLPQAQVGFNYQGDLDRLYARSSFFATEEWLPEGTGKRVVPATTWVQVMSNVHRRQLHVRFEYHESVYARATIQALSDHLKFALRSLAPTRRRAHGSSD